MISKDAFAIKETLRLRGKLTVYNFEILVRRIYLYINVGIRGEYVTSYALYGSGDSDRFKIRASVERTVSDGLALDSFLKDYVANIASLIEEVSADSFYGLSEGYRAIIRL